MTEGNKNEQKSIHWLRKIFGIPLLIIGMSFVSLSFLFLAHQEQTLYEWIENDFNL